MILRQSKRSNNSRKLAYAIHLELMRVTPASGARLSTQSAVISLSVTIFTFPLRTLGADKNSLTAEPCLNRSKSTARSTNRADRIAGKLSCFLIRETEQLTNINASHISSGKRRSAAHKSAKSACAIWLGLVRAFPHRCRPRPRLLGAAYGIRNRIDCGGW